MAHTAIYVSSQYAGESSGFRLSGEVRVSTATPESSAIPWGTTDLPWTMTAVDVNRAIQDAAIAAVQAEGYAVAELDNKIVTGGSVGVM